jgi:hypothetical protein
MDRVPDAADLPSDDLRASDAERDAVVAQLREHGGAGRLSVEELDERIASALAAPTRRDLAALVADLPRLPRPRDRARERRELRDHVRSYLAVMVLLVLIWAVTGAAYFWPIWPILGWGIGVLSHAAAVMPQRLATPA